MFKRPHKHILASGVSGMDKSTLSVSIFTEQEVLSDLNHSDLDSLASATSYTTIRFALPRRDRRHRRKWPVQGIVTLLPQPFL
jgi:hypothetical protein